MDTRNLKFVKSGNSCILRSQFLLDYDFSLALGWLLYQIEYLKTYYSYVMNGEIESFEKSFDITPIIDTIKQKHNITSF